MIIPVQIRFIRCRDLFELRQSYIIWVLVTVNIGSSHLGNNRRWSTHKKETNAKSETGSVGRELVHEPRSANRSASGRHQICSFRVLSDSKVV